MKIAVEACDHCTLFPLAGAWQEIETLVAADLRMWEWRNDFPSVVPGVIC